MFTIDSSDPTPIYAQLERAIRVAVATGRLGTFETDAELIVDPAAVANVPFGIQDKRLGSSPRSELVGDGASLVL